MAGTLLVTATSATGQEFSNDRPNAPVLVGPVFLRPRFEIRDVGVDSNVFNESEPAEDFTATLSAAVEADVLFGSMRVSGRSVSDYVWYRDFAEERSVNSTLGGRFEILAPRFHPWAQVDVVRTRERPNQEIDTRASRREPTIAGGLDIAVGSRTRLEFSVQRNTTVFGSGAFVTVLGGPDTEGGGGSGADLPPTATDESLARQLNNTSDQFTASYRMSLTPLTTWFVDAVIRRDVFQESSFRDANDVRVMTRFEFDATALLSGAVAIGAARFSPRDAGLPGYGGLVGNGGVTLALLDATRFAVDFARDTDYSFETDSPFFVDTGATLTVTQRLLGPLDVVVGAGRQAMDYHSLVEAPVARQDTLTTYRFGVGYSVGDGLRFGVDFLREHRRSTTRDDRSYDRNTVYTSLNYGL